MRKGIFIFICLVFTLFVNGKVKLADVFSHNMVIQQQKPIKVWGTADVGERVKVQIGNQRQMAVADADGRWQLTLKAMSASVKPITMKVVGNKNSIVLRNILIGEVWLASGQSNMEYSMHNHLHYVKPNKGDADFLEHEWEKADNLNIRLFYVEKNLKCDTLPTVGWQTVSQESLKPFSAAAWFFAKMLQDSLKVPVGIISSSWGGTKIEVWTPDQGDRYEKMVKPMASFPLRGFLWYQGESNLIDGEIDDYAAKQQKLVSSWRKAWGDDTLPFYYVQISPLTYSQRKEDIVTKTWLDLPRFWAEQTHCMEIPYSGMVVTTDIPERLNDIHPPYKWVVGERLARWALHNDYGYDRLECCGPTLKDITRQGDKIVLTFDHCEDGLVTSDGKAPDWFYANVQRNGRFNKVNAVIEGCKVVLDVPEFVKHPVIRFGYDEVAQPNLRNKAGLPAIPFETSILEKNFDVKLWKEEQSGIIHVYPAEKGNNARRAIVICPGGGYARLSMENEGYNWVPFFRSLGFTTVILQYRMPNGNPSIPVSDAEQAMRLVRQNAADWDVDPHQVGIMGFSAGGHLASTITVTTDSLIRPDFSILFYPVISMSEEFMHKRSHDCLMGADSSKEMNDRYSSEKHVTDQTPPVFLALSNDDRTVHPLNSISFYEAMLNHNRQVSLHIYPSGRHGWGFRDTFPYHNQMVNELSVWLKAIGSESK